MKNVIAFFIDQYGTKIRNQKSDNLVVTVTKKERI